ncbi:MAG: hypothetical protein WCX71_01315 [Candidatus Buchananbacteria bacterium]
MSATDTEVLRQLVDAAYIAILSPEDDVPPVADDDVSAIFMKAVTTVFTQNRSQRRERLVLPFARWASQAGVKLEQLEALLPAKIMGVIQQEETSCVEQTMQQALCLQVVG